VDDDALAEADAAAMELLRLYEQLGVAAILVTYPGEAIFVRCQNAGDVVPLCKRVIEEHAAPADRTLN
jgi:hypothetical protein